MGSGRAMGSGTTKASNPNYMLFLLLLVTFLNFIDRQAIYIVGERVKQDLHLSDAELGFLMGTSFAVFYGVAGIGMGRIADAVSRTRLLGLALALWSGLTALSGAAANYAMLAIARAGVGIGESASSPCCQALIAEGFPAEKRATAFGIYLIGVHLGGATSLLMGAVVLQHWSTICTWLPGDACALADWRAAFLAVGLPGLVVAWLVYRLKEPPRETTSAGRSRARIVIDEMSAAVPPFTLWNLRKAGGTGAVFRNLALVALLILLATVLIRITGDVAQWCAVAIGAYSILTWGQAMKLRDRELFDMTFGGAVFLPMMLAGALLAVYTSSIGAWTAPYAMRILHAQPVDAGIQLGLASALGGALGAMTGGWLTDHLKPRDVRTSIWMGIAALLLSAPFLVLMLQARDLETYALANLCFHFFGLLWSGVAGALAQDLVLPKMRGAAAGAFTLVLIVVSIGLGPYTVGKMSEISGSLQTGMLSILALIPVSTGLFLLAASRMPSELEKIRNAASA